MARMASAVGHPFAAAPSSRPPLDGAVGGLATSGLLVPGEAIQGNVGALQKRSVFRPPGLSQGQDPGVLADDDSA